MTDFDELRLVDWLRSQVPTPESVRLGIGDDMAIVDHSSQRILISSDMLLDGVHFDSRQHEPKRMGRKAMLCALSDCAAMAARPVSAVVSVALPRTMETTTVLDLFRGMLETAKQYECAIVGGDTTRWNQPLVIDVAITAIPYDRIQPVRRSGAKPGDKLCVTGPLGGSLLGRHLNFFPRLKESKTLATELGDRLHAMIDLSDGLSLDLWRVCEASNTGAILDEPLLEAIIHDDARRAAAMDGSSALEHALGDGEDFELLLAIDSDPTSLSVPIHEIGEVTEHGLHLRHKDGSLEALQPTGFIH